MATIDESAVKDIEKFTKAIWSVRANFEKIQKEKIYWVNELSEKYSSEKNIEECREKLERTNRLEQKYFNLVYKYFLEFFDKIRRIEREIKHIKQNQIRKEHIELLELSKKYWETLIDICNNLNLILGRAKQRIDEEQKHIKRAKGNIFTKDERINFIKEYELFLKSFSEEAAIETSVKALNPKYAFLQSLSRGIRSLGSKIPFKPYDKVFLYMVPPAVIVKLTIMGDGFLDALYGIVLFGAIYGTLISGRRKEERTYYLTQKKFRL